MSSTPILYPQVADYGDLSWGELNHTINTAGTQDVPSVALRILQYGQAYYYHLGSGNFYDARQVINAVALEDACTLADDLPEPVPTPEPLNGQNFSAEEFDFLFEWLGGSDRSFLSARFGGADVCEGFTERFRAFGITVHGAKFASRIEKELREARAAAIRLQVDGMRGAFTSAPTPAVLADQPAAEFDPNTLIGPITRASPQEMERLIATRERRTASGSRISWPFKDMMVGDKVTIEPRLARKAQIAAHVYAARKGWTVSVKKNRITGALVVLRGPDK